MRMRYVFGAAVGSLLAVAGLAGAMAPDESAARAAILARFAKLHNIIVRYTTTSHLKLPPGMRLEDAFVKSGRGGYTVLDVGTRVEREEFSLLGNAIFYTRREMSFESPIKDPAYPKAQPNNYEMEVITPERDELLMALTRDGKREYQGQIRAKGEIPLSYVLVALGLGVDRSALLFTEEDIGKMKINRSRDGKILLQQLHSTAEITNEWTFDPNRGYAITAYRRGYKGKFADTWTMEDFRETSGLLLPHRVHRIHTWEDGTKGPEWIVDVNEYRVADPTNTPQRYRMKWPEGTRVTDYTTGLSYVVHDANETTH